MRKRNIFVRFFIVSLIFIAAFLFVPSDEASATVFGGVGAISNPGQTIKATSSVTTIFSASIWTDEVAKSITDITVGFWGTGFATADLLPSTGGIEVYSSTDGVFGGSGETLITSSYIWSAATATITLTGASLPMSQATNNIFIGIKTSATLANGDTIGATIPQNGINTNGANDLPVSAISLGDLLTADTVPPSAISAASFVMIQNAPGAADQFVTQATASVGDNGDTIKVYNATSSVLIGQALIGPTGQFVPIDIGDNQNASVRAEVLDPAGNNSNSAVVTGNDITIPTVTGANAFSDRIILNLSENVDGMQAMNCANYTVNGSALACSGPGTPFVDFFGNKITIRGLITLSGTVSLVMNTGNITDINGGNNPLSYTNNSLPVSVISMPVVSAITPGTGQAGDTITITGSNFGTTVTPGDDTHKVFFSGGFNPSTGPLPPVEADYTGASWSATSVTVKVPVGAQGGPVTVMVDGLETNFDDKTFFDVLSPYHFKVFYDTVATAMPDGNAGNINAFIGSKNGMQIYSTANGMTYSVAEDTFTIATVSTMGFTWVFDSSGAHLNSDGSEINALATQSVVLVTATRSVSGTITLGSPCTNDGKNQFVVVFASPEFEESSVGPEGGPGDIEPSFFKTNSSCAASYGVGVINSGMYNIEAHLMPTGTVASAPFVDPDWQSVAISDATPSVSNIDFTFTTADRKIHGILKGPNNTDLSQQDVMDLFVGAYQPKENGKGTMTMPYLSAGVAVFDVYVTDGMWKINVGGPKAPSQSEIQVDVDSTYTLGADKGPTIVLSPPSDYIEGYAKDATGTALSNVSVYAFRVGGPGGGNTNTDSQGYYKMYLAPGTGYTVGAHSRDYGFLGEQTGITVSTTVHPTVNFTISSGNFKTVSGQVTKGGVALANAFVFITDGEFGPMVGGVQTDSSGNYSLKTPTGSNRYIHVGLPGKGEVYVGLANIAGSSGTISADITGNNITITSSVITVRISPKADFTQAFVGVHGDIGGAFSDTDVSTSGNPYREYRLEVRRPASGSATYYLDGGIPGYGPLPQVSIGLSSVGAFTESSGTANDGMIEISLSSSYNVTGMVTGSNVLGTRVWVAGPNGGMDTQVASTSGTFSLKLRPGTYDVGASKPGYMGSKTSITVVDADISGVTLSLATNSLSITGSVALPGGSPAANAWVWATNGSGGWAGTSTDVSGAFTLGVTSGEWNVEAAHEGFYSNSIRVSAGATGISINLIAVSGFDLKLKNAPMVPADGGIVQGEGVKVDFPKSALGTDTNSGNVEVKKTTNIPKTENVRIIGGQATEITAKTSTGQSINTLSSNANITLTLSKAEAVASGLTLAQLARLKIAYWDTTSNNWVEISTVTTINPPTASALDDLATNPAVTMVGTVKHLSAFAPTLPTDINAPATPTGVSATAGNGQATLSWSASSGATKYDIYQKSGSNYPYLAQTTSTSYIVTGLTNGTTYYFKVSALNASDQESAASDAAGATPVAPSGGGGVWIPPTQTTTATTDQQEEQTAAAEAQLTATPTLIRIAGDSKVYEVKDGVKVWIPTAEAFRALGYDWADIQEVATDSSRSATLLRAAGDPRVYVINQGRKTWVKTIEAFNAQGYKWEDITVVKAGILSGYLAEPESLEAFTELLRVSGDYKVYFVKDGKKQWIKTAQEFDAKGFRWGDIKDVAASGLTQYSDSETLLGARVIILSSWLRVRKAGSLSAEIIGNARKGQSFEHLGEANGWFRILLSNGTEGWVSGKYSKKQ